MEPATVDKSLERVISQRALQMSNSSSCRVWVVGFLCGICVTYLLIAAVTSFSNPPEFGVTYSATAAAESASPWNSSRLIVGMQVSPQTTRQKYISESHEKSMEQGGGKKLHFVYSAWSAILQGSQVQRNEALDRLGLKGSNIPQAPHLEDCESMTQMNARLDTYGPDRSFPPWLIWKGPLGLGLARSKSEVERVKIHLGHNQGSGNYPPWTSGSDEENIPSTRRVQTDIWVHQHPANCSDPNLRFLVADWERLPGFGIGAQLAAMTGLLAIAVKEKRILVTNYYNRANHDGCKGASRSQWSCYFLSETSEECRSRALDLMKHQGSWNSQLIKVKENYTSKEIWAGRIPENWGKPWEYMQPTTDIEGDLLMHHRKMDRRWWRAQAIRYLMRFKSFYMCNLLNTARHKAFGFQAAEMVVHNLPTEWPQAVINRSQLGMERFVWSSHKPWIPRPILSMHVRMGDKACEMKVVEFEKYMHLAERIRQRFPDLGNIWLSTEMQEVIDKSKLYPNWKFYYTDVTRQTGNSTMASYEASLGRETSTNYPLVNFIMATEADFFVGALGSTWCFLIDGMRNTGGKVMSGYLSVNKDRFW